ncbi:MAG: nicotinate-nucleotide adenylyltransferase [Myxococcota bacterium]
MTAGERLGILGGTFNPIHLGHLRAAEEVRERLSLSRVLLVPSAEPPHKEDVAGDPIAPAELRLRWARTAVADHPGLEVDALEVERGGRSFTVDTVREIAARTAPEPPVFVIGVDAFRLLGTWREPETILRTAHFAVLPRPPERGTLADWLPDCARADFEVDPAGDVAHHREAPTWIRRVDIPLLDVSSSDVRERIRKGLSVRYLVPESVRPAILASGVYAAAS